MTFSKYKVYISEAETLEEAEARAPDDVEVQQGDQGGFFYESEPAGDDSDDEEFGHPDEGPGILDEEGFEYDGYEINPFDQDSIGVDLVDVHEGDLVYVQHPDGDYIAEVSDVESGWSDWKIEFGGGTYEMRPDTTSRPLGLVEEHPELGELEHVRDFKDPFETVGEVVMWEDDAGYPHYSEIVEYSQGDLQTMNGVEIPVSNIEGIVDRQDPVSPQDMYDIPEEGQEFNQDLAEAVVAGDATELPAYKYMSNAGSIEDEQLAVDAYKSILANEGNKTQRERMERRLRGMGLEPAEYRETSVNPEEVPDKRKGTVFETYDSEQMVETAAAVASSMDSVENWEAWNDFFDHMTQPELKESLEKAVQEQTYISAEDPTDMDDEEYDWEEQSFLADGKMSLMSRMEEGSFQEVDSIIKKAPDQKMQSGLKEMATHFLKSAEDRRKAYDTYGMGHTDFNKVQFRESYSPEDRVQGMGRIHTKGTAHDEAYALRAAVYGWKGEDNQKVNGYNGNRAIAPIEPTENMVEAIEHNQEQIRNKILESPDSLPDHMQQNLNADGTITVYRGISSKISGFSSVESWSTRKSVAAEGMFDGKGVLKADVEPEDILAAYQENHEMHPGEREVTLIGDQVADKWEVEEGDPIDYDELGKSFMVGELEGMFKAGSFVIAQSHEEVEAAIFDDMYDPGMFTSHRIVGEGDEQEIVPVEDLAESEPDSVEEPEEQVEGKTGGIAQLAEEIASAAAESASQWLGKERLEKPQELEDCVDSVMEDQDVSESQAYAICNSQMNKAERVLKTREHVDSVHEAPEDAVVHVELDEEGDPDGLYFEKSSPLVKYRVYVDDPSEVPEDAEVQEGEEGGVYYETEPGEGGYEPGGVVEVDNFGVTQEVEVVDNLPNDKLLVETEEGDQFTVDRTEIVGEEAEDEGGGDVLDDIMGDFDDLPDPDEEEEDDMPTEEEERQIREERAEEAIEEYGIDPHEPPDPDEEPSGVTIDQDDVETGEKTKVEEEHREALQDAIENPDWLGVPVDIVAEGEDVDYGPWDDQTDVIQYDGDPDWTAGYTDVEMDIDDFLATQAAMLRRPGQSEEDNYNGFYAALEDKVEDYEEVFEEEPGEMPMPYIELGEDGNPRLQQEGRHRAVAAKMAGEETLPVRMVIRTDAEGYSEEEYEEMVSESETQSKLAKSDVSFEEVDDAFMKCYENAVWWKVAEDDPDLSKAPAIWESSGQIPDFVREFIEEAFEQGAFWAGQFEDLAEPAADRLRDILEENMTQPQGWSLGSMVDDLLDAFPNLDKDDALTIARNETAAAANKGREIAYEARDDTEEYDFYWSGPEDTRTTPICTYIKEVTHPNHGGSPAKGMDALKEVLLDAMDPSVNPHLDSDWKGMTPERVDEWVPHFQCRHTFVQKAYL